MWRAVKSVKEEPPRTSTIACWLPICCDARRAAGPLQSAYSVRFVCLRGSGDVAPSAPALLTRDLSRPVSSAIRSYPSTTRLWDLASARAAQAALGQVVLSGVRPGDHGHEAVLGPHGGQHGQVPLDLAPDAAERDAEHSLAALEQVHYLVRRGAFVDADPVAHQRHLGQVLAAMIAQVLDRGPDLLQRDPRVEQPLDDLQHQDVAEAVQALGSGTMGGPHARLDQAGARPVVKLAVGDPGRRARSRPSVADLRRPGADLGSDPEGLVSLEQRTLRAWRVARGSPAAVIPGYRHAYL